MSEFTQDKWKYDESVGVIFNAKTLAIIANVYGAGTGSCFCRIPEGQANARLIVAAPEMYSELSYFVAALRRYNNNPYDEELPSWQEAEELLKRIDGEENDDE